MFLLLLALAMLVVSGLAALWRPRLGVCGIVAACAIGLIPSVRVLLGGATESLRLAWNVPYGAFFVEVDALSAFFLIPIFGLSALTAIYGIGRRRIPGGVARKEIARHFLVLL